MKSWQLMGLVAAAGVAAGVAGSFIYLSGQNTATLFNADCLKQFPLTNYTLDCDTYDNISTKLHTLNDKLKEVTDAYESQGKASHVSVWVRDLTTLQWATSNQLQNYAPASLLKLPLMIAYYKIAELDPTILTNTLQFTGTSTAASSDSQNFIPGDKLVSGHSYTVEQLIEHMIEQSDNDAATLLLSRMDPTIFENTLIDLGIKIPSAIKNFDFITVKSYSSIFRQLYNASYLNREYSQKALDILSKTSFKGIDEPLPVGTKVAHKFGERVLDESNPSTDVHELHDCGIIYKGEHPYSLCIMTQGKNFDDLLTIIKNISLFVYNNL